MKTKKLIVRGSALIMAVIMLFTITPVQIFAADNGKEAAVAVEAADSTQKSDVSISLKQNYKYFDEDMPADLISTNVADTFDYYCFTLGIFDSLAAVYVNCLNKDIGDFILEYSWLYKEVFGDDFSAIKLSDGISREDFGKLLYSQVLADECARIGIDSAALSAMQELFNSIPESVTKVSLRTIQPNQTGTYTMFAVAANPAYNTAFSTSAFYVKYHTTGKKLVFVSDASRGLDSVKAKHFDFSAVVTKDGIPVQSDNVRYIYSGFRQTGLVYFSTKNPPRVPGTFYQTVWTLGGTYAFPQTRKIVITIF